MYICIKSRDIVVTIPPLVIFGTTIGTYNIIFDALRCGAVRFGRGIKTVRDISRQRTRCYYYYYFHHEPPRAHLIYTTLDRTVFIPCEYRPYFIFFHYLFTFALRPTRLRTNGRRRDRVL